MIRFTPQSRHWSAAYVGIPFRSLGRTIAGVDCWGMVRLVYAAELGITLPGYDGLYISTEERAEIAAIVGEATSGPVWHDVSTAPVEFDVAVFRRGELPCHVGVLIGGTRMLHADRRGCRVEDFAAPRWASQLAAVYRHRDRV
jgi:probable lipoprotein NlpC